MSGTSASPHVPPPRFPLASIPNGDGASAIGRSAADLLNTAGRSAALPDPSATLVDLPARQTPAQLASESVGLGAHENVAAPAPETGADAAPGASHSYARLLTHAPEYRPSGIIILQPNQRIEVQAQGVIYDVDETILAGTAEHVHDGKEARFAQAVALLIKQRGSDFDLSTWDEKYRVHTGVAETDVCVRLAQQVYKDYGIELTAREIREASQQVLDERFQTFMDKVSLVKNVADLIERNRRAGLKGGVCTASSEAFVKRALEYFGLYSMFEAHVYEATKKIGDALFSEVSIQKACHGLGLAPQTCVMIGDSISDFGAAASGERPLDLVILRLPSGEEQKELEKFRLARESALAKNGDALTRTVVVIVRDYSQILITKANQQRVTFEIPHVEPARDGAGK